MNIRYSMIFEPRLTNFLRSVSYYQAVQVSNPSLLQIVPTQKQDLKIKH